MHQQKNENVVMNYVDMAQFCKPIHAGEHELMHSKQKQFYTKLGFWFKTDLIKGAEIDQKLVSNPSTFPFINQLYSNHSSNY